MPLDLSRTRQINPIGLGQVLVRLVGCGNLGSAAAIALCRMGLEHFQLYDHDKVEKANLSTQQFGHAWVGVDKVHALMGQMLAINPTITTHPHAMPIVANAAPARSREEPYHNTVMIAATDNMESRRVAWASFAAHGAVNGCGLFVDLRMALEDFEIWAVRHPMMEDSARDEYANLLRDPDIQYDEAACGASSSGATGLGLTGFTTPIIRRYLNDLPFPKHIVGNLGRGQVNTYWRTGEPWVDEQDALMARAGGA